MYRQSPIIPITSHQKKSTSTTVPSRDPIGTSMEDPHPQTTRFRGIWTISCKNQNVRNPPATLVLARRGSVSIHMYMRMSIHMHIRAYAREYARSARSHACARRSQTCRGATGSRRLPTCQCHLSYLSHYAHVDTPADAHVSVHVCAHAQTRVNTQALEQGNPDAYMSKHMSKHTGGGARQPGRTVQPRAVLPQGLRRADRHGAGRPLVTVSFFHAEG